MNNSIAETLEKHWFVVTKNKDPTLERQNSSQEVKKQPSSRQHFSVSVHRTEIFNYATVDLAAKSGLFLCLCLHISFRHVEAQWNCGSFRTSDSAILQGVQAGEPNLPLWSKQRPEPSSKESLPSRGFLPEKPVVYWHRNEQAASFQLTDSECHFDPVLHQKKWPPQPRLELWSLQSGSEKRKGRMESFRWANRDKALDGH